MTTTTDTAVRVIRTAHHGAFGEWEGIVYTLTDCCQASGKGSESSPTNIVCRACHRPVPARMGMAVLLDDPDFMHVLVTMLPDCRSLTGDPYDCANEVAYRAGWLNLG